MEGIVYIGAEKLCPHPDNPRKDLGDLAELTESIRKNGIMQNLTVIPKEDDPESYMILIGHRRYAAGKAAGVTAFPCRITEGLSQREQLSIMLEENMQRSDLSILEQAQGFQMMLDLGETEESISEKTGFSRSTVRHRLNIAKLNPNLIKEKQQDEFFQLSLTDLYKLEKLKDVKDRERILEEADTSSEISEMVEYELKKQNRDEIAAFIIKELEALGIKAFPKDETYDSWSKWETVKEYDLDDGNPETIEIDTEEDERELLYIRAGYQNYYLRVVRKARRVKKELSPWEKRQKEKKELIKELKAVLDSMAQRRKWLIDRIISGKRTPVKDELGHMKALWKNISDMCYSVGQNSYYHYLSGKKESWQVTMEDMESLKDQVSNLTEIQEMLITLHFGLCYQEGRIVSTYRDPYNKDAAEKVMDAYMVLKPYGWFFEEDEKKVLEGTHEYYEKLREKG